MKGLLSQLLEATCQARRGQRLALARQVWAARAEITPSSAAECEFNSPHEYAETYARLAAALGAAGKTPPRGESEFLASMRHRPVEYPGAVGWKDYYFLTAFVSILAPQRVIEIGTSTGFSAAIIAAALHRQHARQSDVWVDTIDVSPQCFIDATRPTGFEIPELIPDLIAMVRLHIPHDSTLVGQLARRNELALVFIDANHRHPRPLLDLLRLAPYVRSGGWVLLHDIQLGTLGRAMVESGEALSLSSAYGAEWLFERWPFRKIGGGTIGAVQLPNDKSALVSFALQLMSMPFEINAGTKGQGFARARHALYQSFADLL